MQRQPLCCVCEPGRRIKHPNTHKMILRLQCDQNDGLCLAILGLEANYQLQCFPSYNTEEHLSELVCSEKSSYTSVLHETSVQDQSRLTYKQHRRASIEPRNRTGRGATSGSRGNVNRVKPSERLVSILLGRKGHSSC